MEEEHEALALGQGGDRSSELGIRLRTAVSGKLFTQHRGNRPRRLRPPAHPSRVHDHPPDPSLEGAFSAERLPIADSTRERLLHGIAGRLVVAENPAGDAPERGKSRPVQRLDLRQRDASTIAH